ncbi:glycosyltransferase family 4 protein [bacterium]|jgi:glycosyltransferase involved in cell wall biosynthesis|nr:glycosyltransferase family 4 protein [bacterium]
MSLSKKHPDVKRILVVIDSLGYGGAERLLVSILPKINKNSLIVDVVVLLSDISLMPELTKQGVNVIPLNAPNRWSFFKILKSMNKHMKMGNYDIVWGHLYFGNLYSVILGYFFPKLKVIWTLHSPGYSNNPPKKVAHKIKAYVEQYFGNNRVDSIVAVSKSVASDYKNTTNWKLISVIYNGVDFSTFPHASSKKDIINIRGKYKINKSDFLIVTPGRYAPEKGHKFMIDALERLSNKHGKQVQWISVGSGTYKVYVDKLRKSSGIANNIHLLDSMPHQELLLLMQSSDLVVIPSIKEPFGIAAVESMGLGIPTITSYVDGLIEVVSGDIESINNVTHGNSRELAQAIFIMLGDARLRDEVSSIGKNRALSLFDIKHSVDKWAGLLRDV